jgi:hypothetical protein
MDDIVRRVYAVLEYWCYKAGKEFTVNKHAQISSLRVRENYGELTQTIYEFDGSIVTMLENIDFIIICSPVVYLEGNEKLDSLLEELQQELVIMEKWLHLQ